MKKLLILFICLIGGNLYANSTRSLVEIPEQIGLAHQFVSPFVTHRGYIDNETDSMMLYVIHYNICVFNQCDNSHWYRIKVAAHSHWEGGMQTRITGRFNAPGSYQIYGQTVIDGENGSRQFGYGNIMIT